MRTALILVAWLATVGGAFYFGTRFESEERASTGVDDLTVHRAAREAETPDSGPVLRPLPTSSQTPGSALAGAVAAPVPEAPATPDVGVTLEPFDLSTVTDSEAALALFRMHVEAYLARGAEGHLDLLRFINENLVENEDLQRLFSSEAEASRVLYPMIEFLVQRKDQVVDVVETLYETLAEDPAQLEGLDDNTLEIFTEGVSFVLPGAVDEARMDTFRAHARKFLERDEASLPKVVQQVRRDVERVLRIWAPRMGADEALAKLKSGEIQGPEALAAIRTIPPEQLAGLDLAPYLTSGIAQGEWQTFRALEDLPLSPRDVAMLDQAILQGTSTGQVHEWHVRRYLQSTQRAGWPAAQSFIELGLRQVTKEARAPYAQVLGGLKPRPEADYARWVLETYELPPNAVEHLKRSFGLE